MKKIDLSNARMTHVVMHWVGNKAKDEKVNSSDAFMHLSEELQLTLQDYFLRNFKEEFYKFRYDELALNPVYIHVESLFSSKGLFVEHSKYIAEFLYSVSVHPHIKSGNLYIAHFRGCEIEGVELNAIGIFKAETKEHFLIDSDGLGTNQVQLGEGYSIKTLDKGCLIFNTFEKDGYSILMFDKGKNQLPYWRDDFLQITRIQDESYITEKYLQMLLDFAEDVILLNKTHADFILFRTNTFRHFTEIEEFNLMDFKEEILALFMNDQKIFDGYVNDLVDGSYFPPAEEGFTISKYAVKKMKKYFKQPIKLDTGMKIQIDPKDSGTAHDYLEEHYDEQRGIKYYKLYFGESE